MRAHLYTDWRSIPSEARGAAAALGNFDGVHLGHAHLVHTLHLSEPDKPLAVVTFEPHPRELFRPEDPPFRLTLADERFAALAALGVQHVFQIAFDEAFSRMPAERFIDDVLHDALGVKHIACGHDFAFGYRRGGTTSFLAERASELGIGVSLVPALADADGPYSSTRIRRLLQDGYPERAATELGRPWSIRGEVCHGDKRGRLLGFPTANVRLGRHLEPARGVYTTTVRLPDGRTRDGVANIGRRPTIADGSESRMEVHIFDLSEDLYGQTISIALHDLLRPEKKFESLDALKQQIATDTEQARLLLQNRRNNNSQ